MAYEPPPRSWLEKFGESFRGVFIGARSESSIWVHIFFMAAVVIAAAALRVTRTDWCLLILCISLVITAEYLNTGLEKLAKSMQHEFDPVIRDALDLGSGAVLIAAIGAAVVGLIVFVPRLLEFV